MLPYFTEKFGNAGSLHSKGLDAKQDLDSARATIAKYLNCQPSEIIFTGSGTESNNLAIIGTAKANKDKGNHIITSNIEHPSVLDVFKYLEKEGFKVTYLEVDPDGFIDPKQVEEAITKETTLVSIMYANNEIGAIEPVEEIANICQKHKVIFHTDACQIAEYQNIDTKKIPLDLLTINGSKLYGPKGIAFLYVRKGTQIEALFQGGSQEQGLRAGTQNTPAIMGLAKAFEIAQENHKEESIRTTKLRDYFIENILKKIPDASLNGSQKNRLPNNINLYIPNISGKELLLLLDSKGIFVSTGSACNSGKDGDSHVLNAICRNKNISQYSIRISIGKQTTKEDLDYVIETLPKIVTHMRA